MILNHSHHNVDNGNDVRGLDVEGVSSTPGADETNIGGRNYNHLVEGDRERMREKIRLQLEKEKRFEQKKRARDTLGEVEGIQHRGCTGDPG